MKKILPLKHKSLVYNEKRYLAPKKGERGKTEVQTIHALSKKYGVEKIVNKINEIINQL